MYYTLLVVHKFQNVSDKHVQVPGFARIIGFTLHTSHRSRCRLMWFVRGAPVKKATAAADVGDGSGGPGIRDVVWMRRWWRS